MAMVETEVNEKHRGSPGRAMQDPVADHPAGTDDTSSERFESAWGH